MKFRGCNPPIFFLPLVLLYAACHSTIWRSATIHYKVMYTSTNVRDDTIFYNVYSSFFWCSFTQRDGSTGYEQQVFSAITTLLHEISSIMALITMEYRKKPTNRLKNRGDWRVSNSRHPQSQCSALPLSYNRHLFISIFNTRSDTLDIQFIFLNIMTAVGLEPTTIRLKVYSSTD